MEEGFLQGDTADGIAKVAAMQKVEEHCHKDARLAQLEPAWVSALGDCMPLAIMAALHSVLVQDSQEALTCLPGHPDCSFEPRSSDCRDFSTACTWLKAKVREELESSPGNYQEWFVPEEEKGPQTWEHLLEDIVKPGEYQGHLFVLGAAAVLGRNIIVVSVSTNFFVSTNDFTVSDHGSENAVICIALFEQHYYPMVSRDTLLTLRVGAQRRRKAARSDFGSPEVITHFFFDDEGTFYARYGADSSGFYHASILTNIKPTLRAQFEEAMTNRNQYYTLKGGAWSGADTVGSLPSNAPAFPVVAQRVVVPFQRKANYCVFGSVLNAKSVTGKQKEIIKSIMVQRSNLAELRTALEQCKCGLQLLNPKRWYPYFSQDGNLSLLLDWVLSGEASGELIANVEEKDGSREHFLLLDCDEMVIYDTSPKYGRYTHPLTESTICMMEIVAICRAAKLDNKNVPKRLQ